MYITGIEVLYDNRNLFVGLDIATTLVYDGASSKGLDLSATVCRELIEWLTQTDASLWRFRLSTVCPRNFIVTLSPLGGVAGCVCCTNSRRPILSRTLTRGPSLSSFLGQAVILLR